MHSFSDRLREQRDALGLSQQALADGCGIALRSQQNYEKGLRSPDADYLAALHKQGFDVLYVLTGIDAAAHGRLATLEHAIGQAGQRTDSFEETKRLGTALNTQMQAPTARVTPRERTLLDNYRAADESGKKLIEGTAALSARAANPKAS